MGWQRCAVAYGCTLRALTRGALIALLGSGCAIEARPKQWEPLDYVALDEALRAPTGKLAEVSPEELLVDIPAVVSALIQTALLYDRVRRFGKPPAPDGGIDGGAFPDGGPPLPGIDAGARDMGSTADLGAPAVPTEAAEGAGVYVKLACPGPELTARTRDFSFGALRVDSPAFTSTDIELALVRGHLLLSFEQCQTAVGTLSGESPAYYDFARDWLGVRLLLSLELANGSQAPPVDVSAVNDADRYQLLLQDASARTYVLTVRLGDEIAITLAGADQVIGCAYTEDPPAIDCESP
jgi:hypothetical protein